MEGLPIILLCSALVSVLTVSVARDTITPTESITDGQTLVSTDGSFELGFFRPGNSTNRYLGIWYKKISNGTVVCVANRESPLTDSAGELKLSGDGVICLLNRAKAVVWSSQPPRGAKNPVLQILDSGNLVIRDANNDRSERYLWQSFDYPCDTLMPGMKLGRNFRTGLKWSLTSWKSSDDPSRGESSYEFDPRGYPQLVLRKGSVLKYRNGPWNGLRFANNGLRPNPIYRYAFVYNEEEVYYTYDLYNSSVISRLVMNQSGFVQRFIRSDRIRGWNLFYYMPGDQCDNYALCGAYGNCNINNSPNCQCLKGFVPKSPQDWDLMDWSGGCVRHTPLGCNGDGFLKYSGVKWPDTVSSLVNMSMNLNECKSVCLKNCSCTAYSNADIRGEGSGCLLWFGDLVDIREFDFGVQDIYIRMAYSELAQYEGSKKNESSEKKRVRIIVTSTLMVLAVLLAGLACYIWRKSANKEGSMEDLELPIFNLTTIVNATDNFAPSNKLGEGGFGPVYQGRLVTGEEIAVKRLSRNSGQGLDEFKNEVKLIANLQHRNLVKLLGCCIQGGETMLIYEYMPNKSLDFFIFDQTRSELLDWQKRNDIISGIARGILYLHQDSRLRIIHRDLKASNILLDAEMNPKISDFGMARIFRGNQTEANTSRVVGTYGYMSPEYAVDGIFSTKSDVFSFGVLVLEIISGKKNRGFYHEDHQHNLLGHAWRLWNEGKPLELTDAPVAVSSNLSDVRRCIHVGLLCVQQSPEDRPSMSDVVLMLGSENATLPQPKHPGFFTERNILELDSSPSKQQTHSINEITNTLLDGR